ncbi:hypothetical protein ACUC2M_22410 [Bacillus cytotoxicus]
MRWKFIMMQLKKGAYTSYIAEETYMDMMYMPDALQAIISLMEADPSKLVHRNAFNITAMSFEPEQIACSEFANTFQHLQWIMQ